LEFTHAIGRLSPFSVSLDDNSNTERPLRTRSHTRSRLRSGEKIHCTYAPSRQKSAAAALALIGTSGLMAIICKRWFAHLFAPVSDNPFCVTVCCRTGLRYAQTGFVNLSRIKRNAF
jgi:hypothetical protein